MRIKRIANFARTLTLFCVGLLLYKQGFSQTTAAGDFIDIAKIPPYQVIRDQSQAAFLPANASLPESYQSLKFKDILFFQAIPSKYITWKLVLRFFIRNSSAMTDSAWFFPGFYYSSIHLYRLSGDRLLPIPCTEPPIQDSIGYRLLTMAPNDSAGFLAELNFVKTYTNVIKPRLIEKSHLSTFIFELSSGHLHLNIITYLFCGLFLMMIFFSIGNYLLGGNREFLYYAGYAFFLGTLLFIKTYYEYKISHAVFFMEAYLDFMMQCAGIVFYIVFMQKFLSTRLTYPFLNRLYTIAIFGLFLSMLFFSYSYFLTNNFIFLNSVENTTKVALLGLLIIFLVYCGRYWKDRLLRYLFWGNFFYFLFSVFSQAIIWGGQPFAHLPVVFNSALFYYELGLFLELVFFLGGLTYKSKREIIEQTKERERLKIENERKELEKHIAVVTAQQEERNRISVDMHDELGSGMTHIRLMSEIAKNKMKQNTPPELERISQSADEVLNKMNAIIWSMNSKNDSLGNLVSYIRAYATEYFEGTQIKCRVNVPDYIPELELTGDKRRSIFLCVKETLNNVLKHSKATELGIEIMVHDQLTIKIADNGVGIDVQNIRQFGNGLQNIDRRMKIVGGLFEIRNNKGTESLLSLPLH